MQAFGVLDRYIGKTIFNTIMMTLFMLVSLSGIIKFVDQLKKSGQGSYDALGAGLYTILSVPKDIQIFFPMAALLGALLGLGMLAQRSELVVMQASGFTRLQVALAVMKTAIPLVLLTMAIGEWVAPQGDQAIDVINSASEEIIGRVPLGNAADVDAAVSAAKAAFETWSTTDRDVREKYLREIQTKLGERSKEIATLISQTQQETRETVEGIEHVGPQINDGLQKVNAVSGILDNIAQDAAESMNRAIEVADATREQSIAANAIASNVEQIAQMTEETAATIHANAESAAQLQEMAGELRDQVAYFKVSR